MPEDLIVTHSPDRQTTATLCHSERDRTLTVRFHNSTLEWWSDRTLDFPFSSLAEFEAEASSWFYAVDVEVDADDKYELLFGAIGSRVPGDKVSEVAAAFGRDSLSRDQRGFILEWVPHR